MMNFQIIARNQKEFTMLYDKFNLNSNIFSAHFFPSNKVVVYFEKEKLADFADLIRNLDVEISNPIANF